MAAKVVLVGMAGGRFALERPVGEQRFQLLHHLVAVEIAADGHDEVGGMEPLLVELLQVLACD